MKLQLTEKETCPRCGSKFECGKSGKCWCYEIEIAPSILENIQQNYDSCLCPVCLEEMSNLNK